MVLREIDLATETALNEREADSATGSFILSACGPSGLVTVCLQGFTTLKQVLGDMLQ